MDAQILSRIQFGFTIGFHIIFPTINIGLAIFLVLLEGMWVTTRQEVYFNLCRFFGKLFAITFGMGVISGVVLSYQLGTNFGPFMQRFGSVLGVLMSYETFTVFFLQAGFLGVMLFGWNRVNVYLHFLATLFVAIGLLFSTFWIMSANSWMQFPTGYLIDQGQFFIAKWWQAVFNPTFLMRYFHMLVAAFITSMALVAGVCAWYLKRNRFEEFSKKGLSFAVISLFIAIPLQVYFGGQVGQNVYQYQPVKAAAIGAVWETEKSVPFYLFAVPDQKTQQNSYTLGIPGLASSLFTGSSEGEIKGLKSVAKKDQPAVKSVFYSYRLMMFLGIWLFILSIIGVILRLMNQLQQSRWYLSCCVCSAPTGLFATLSGWMAAEMGRQPWIVNQLMRTHDAVSFITPDQVRLSLALFVGVYGIVFSFYLLYLFRLIANGPTELSVEHAEDHVFQYMTG